MEYNNSYSEVYFTYLLHVLYTRMFEKYILNSVFMLFIFDF